MWCQRCGLYSVIWLTREFFCGSNVVACTLEFGCTLEVLFGAKVVGCTVAFGCTVELFVVPKL